MYILFTYFVEVYDFCVSLQAAIRNKSSNYERVGPSLSPGCRTGMCSNINVHLHILIYFYVLLVLPFSLGSVNPWACLDGKER